MTEKAAPTFIPAKPRRKLIWLMEWLNHFIMLPLLRIEVRVAAEDLDCLHALPQDAGLLVASNHPSFSDPFVVFEVSRVWGRYCTWMAARELFSRLGGWMGSFIRRTGAFSVWRGGANRDAAVFVRQILYNRRFPVVIFPEGHTFYLNDHLLPLKPGVAAWAVDTVAEHADLPVLVVPMIIKYIYTQDIRQQLERAVAAMEKMVLRRTEPVPPGEFWSRLYVRLFRIADVILTRQERRHHIDPRDHADMDDRVHTLCSTIIEQLERRYMGENERRAVHGDFFDRARHLMALLKDEDDPEHQKDAIEARFAWALSTFHAGYLSPDSSPERFAETVMKLLREITHRVPLSFRAWRTAYVRVGEPIDVRQIAGERDLKDVSVRHRLADEILDVLSQRMRGLLALDPRADLVSRQG